MADTLTRLLTPVAVDPQYIAAKTEKLKVSKQPLSPDWDVLHENGTRLFTVVGEPMSLSHRKTVKDSNFHKIYQIRREVIWLIGDDNTYYAEASEGGPRIWEMIPKQRFTGTETVLNFLNHANGGKPDHLDFKNNPIGSTGYVKYHGQTVAEIHKNRWQLGTEYDMTVVQGLDMSLMMGLLISMHDLIESRTSSS